MCKQDNVDRSSVITPEGSFLSWLMGAWNGEDVSLEIQYPQKMTEENETRVAVCSATARRMRREFRWVLGPVAPMLIGRLGMLTRVG